MWFLYIGPVLLERRFTKQRYYRHFVDLIKLVQRCLQFEYSAEDVDFIRDGFISWVKQYERYVFLELVYHLTNVSDLLDSIYYQHNPSRLSACPVTIHALLHIADSIVNAGPVWASWAFPMERYCSTLQPAITSRRFPFASIDRYLVNHTNLQLIRLLYTNAKESLNMHLKDRSRQADKGAVCIIGYDRCVLLPKKARIVLPPGTLDKVVGHLCTRFSATPTVVKRHLPREFEQWACVRIKGDDEVVRAASMKGRTGEDNRDASYVRYNLDVDRNARFRNMESVFEARDFYGQVQHFIVVPLPIVQSIGLEKPTTLVLAIIRSCVIEDHHLALNTHYYSRTGSLDVVDLTTIKCLIGRIKEPCRGQWATIDRTVLETAHDLGNEDGSDAH
ncbi:hypothetical protein BC629DRAFT_1297723 [Irpex lacteus]|nr:hypothetical protein BC629DRAFT_1297723 [Irpex lacteus]